MDKTFIKRYKKNIRFLKQNYPDIYKKLTTRIEDRHFQIELIQAKDGINLYMDGKLLYSSVYEEELIEQVEQYKEIIKKKVMHIDIDFKKKGFWDDSIQINSLTTVANIAKKYQTKGFANNRYIPFLLVFGVGLGRHIDLLLQEFTVKNLVLIEQDIELIRPLLYLYDFERLFADVELFIAYGKEPEFIKEQVLEFFQKKPIYVDFYEEYFLYKSDIFLKAAKLIEDNIVEVAHTFGFFDDEIMSIEHTLQNIKQNPPFYKRTKTLPKESVVFIIGSGPSLDDDLEYIKKNQDKALIFSCGTALKPLLDHGIVPDYEFVLERTKAPYDAFINSAPKEQLHSIKKVLSNHIYPKFFQEFTNCYMVPRNSDVGSTLLNLGYANALFLAVPTVTNFALAFALHQGAEEIYLFGVDLGYKDPTRHHAKSSIYYNLAEFETKKMSQEYELEGNFGGTFYSNSILYTAKLSIEKAIRCYETRVYNCSDGVKIEGAFSLKARDISLYSHKAPWLDVIEKNFTKRYFEDIHIVDKLEQVSKNFEKLFANIPLPKNDLSQLYEQIEQVQEIVQSFQSFPTFYMLVKGTIYKNLSIALLYLHSIANTKNKVFFLQEILTHIQNVVKIMQKRFEETKKFLQ